MEFPYRHINVLVMPTNFCNMNCVYCFNGRKTHDASDTMPDGTLKQLFRITIPYYERVAFIWHGGEPLSMGLEFFAKVVEYQKGFRDTGTIIRNSIQSNLTLLDKRFARGLHDLGYSIGGSYDGTQNALTRGCDEAILVGYDAAFDAGVKTGVICVVQSHNVNYLLEDYEWFKSRGVNYTLNPYLAKAASADDELYVAPHIFVLRIIELYDYWAHDVSCNISIDYFMTFVDYLLFKQRKKCCYSSCLGKYIGVHSNGDVYPCNRDFPNQYCFGNVHDYADIRQCFASEGFDRLLKDAIFRRNKCASCKVRGFCNGGCNNNALIQDGITNVGGFSCQILVPVYDHIEQSLETMKSLDLSYLAENYNPALYGGNVANVGVTVG